MASNTANPPRNEAISGSQIFLVENEQNPDSDVVHTAVAPSTISSAPSSKPTKEFESVNLAGAERKRIPKRIIHFSDGVLEEYSTDEEDGEEEKPTEPPVDPKKLRWLPYFWYYFIAASTRTLGACDFLGEKLAYMLGITSPKYQYAINEYNRLMEEEKKELKKIETDRELKRKVIAENEAVKVFAKEHGNNSSPALATDL